MEKNNINIESYEGSDAYYEGSDKDYEDFLKQVDGHAGASESAASVEGAENVPLGETINIRGVIDMVRRKAGEISEAAKKIGGEVKGQINDYIAFANEKAEGKKPEPETAKSEPGKTAEPTDKIGETLAEQTIVFNDKDEASGIPASVSGTAKAAKSHIKSASAAAKEKLEEISSIGADFDKITEGIDSLIEKIDAASSKINEIEIKQIENKNNYDRGVNDLRVSINGINGDISEMKQNTGNIMKLSDAVFDLKNSQQNSRKSIEALEAQLAALKKKCVAGIAVVSVLSAIIIVLQIIGLLS